MIQHIRTYWNSNTLKHIGTPTLQNRLELQHFKTDWNSNASKQIGTLTLLNRLELQHFKTDWSSTLKQIGSRPSKCTNQNKIKAYTSTDRTRASASEYFTKEPDIKLTLRNLIDYVQ
jgi:hypothetical protein